MSSSLKAVFFDVDGVLIDSLPQHLQICRDKAAEFGLPLSIPTVEQFRDLVHRGVRVSPMLNFFLAVGFPPDEAERAVDDYETQFMARYRPPPFAGVERMLRTLSGAGLTLGILTANTRGNVEPTLGTAMRYFDERLLFFFDRSAPLVPKSVCLVEGALRLGLPPAMCGYVGDQPADAVAAKEAGYQFVGVGYGWGIAPDDRRFNPVASVAQIAEAVLGDPVGLRRAV